jgi:superfamily II DNA helicase RecQ
MQFIEEYYGTSEMKAASIDQFDEKCDKIKILEEIKNEQYKVIFLTPEMTKNVFFGKMHENIEFIVIDEGQCFESIEAFRKDMIDFKQLRNDYMGIPWIVFNAASIREEQKQQISLALRVLNDLLPIQ